MADNIYNSLIAEFQQAASFDDYKNAYMLYDLRHGSSKGREWKASVFFVLAVGAVWYASVQHFRLNELIMPALVLVISVYMCVYYLFIVPSRSANRAERIYKSSWYISREKQYKFYRDNFTYKNEYEYQKRYYTEIYDCIETKDTFILIGGLENSLTVIDKRQLDPKQREALSSHFRSEMIRQYRNTEGKRK